MLTIALLLAGWPVDVAADCWIHRSRLAVNPRLRTAVVRIDVNSPKDAIDVSGLNTAARKRRVNIVGFSPATCEEVRRYVRRHRIRFPVAAGVKSLFTIAPTEAPTGVWLIPAGAWDRGSPAEVRPAAEPARVEVEEDLPGADAVQESADFDRVFNLSASGDLQDFILGDYYEMARRFAVKRLWEATPDSERAAFADFATQALEEEVDPFVSAELEFYRDLSLGVRRADSENSYSVKCIAEYERNPDDPRFALVRQVEHRLRSGAAQDLAVLYDENPGGSADRLVIRRTIVTRLRECQDRDAARRLALHILRNRSEPDDSIRLQTVMALCGLCRSGDEEAAALLEELALNEPNRRMVRATMEYTSHYLRTGED